MNLKKLVTNRKVLGLIMFYSVIQLCYSIYWTIELISINVIFGVGIGYYMIIPNIIIIALTYLLLTRVFKYQEK